MPFDLPATKSERGTPYDGPALRVHVGLEAVSDLIADLEAGFSDFERIAAGVAPHTR